MYIRQYIHVLFLFLTLIKEIYVAFVPDSLSCWSLADANTHTNTFTFDLLIKGFIPTALTAALTSVMTKKEAGIIINNVTGVAQNLFKDEI